MMRPALNRLVKDYFGDNPPADAMQALHAAILADRQATIGWIIRRWGPDGFYDKRVRDGASVSEILGEAWELPTGLEDLF